MIKDDHLGLREILSISWRITKKHYWLLTIFTVILFCISTFSNLLSLYLLNKVNFGLSTLLGLFFLVSYTIINLGLTKAIFWILDKDNEDFEIEQIQPTVLQVGNYLISTMLYIGVFLVGGYILIYLFSPLIMFIAGRNKDFQFYTATLSLLPLLFLFLRAYFYQYFILDKDLSPLEAIMGSYKYTKRKVLKIFFIFSVFGLFYLATYFMDSRNFILAGIVLRVFNFFFIVPLTSVAMVILYRNLVNYYEPQQDEVQQKTPNVD